MLNAHERQILADLEVGLAAQDPDLAGKLRDHQLHPRPNVPAPVRAIATTLLVAGVLALLTGAVMPGGTGLMLLVVAAMLGFLVQIVLIPLRRPSRRARPRPPR
jgi:hypothetical protein